MVARRTLDVLQRRRRRRLSHLAAAILRGSGGAAHLRTDRGGRPGRRAGRGVDDYLRWPGAADRLVPRRCGRPPDFARGVRVLSAAERRWPATVFSRVPRRDERSGRKRAVDGRARLGTEATTVPRTAGHDL